MTTKLQEREDHELALRQLEDIKPGDTIYTSVNHVARSGMTRWISAYVVRDDEIRDISWAAAKVTGRNVNNRNNEGVECGGCGMDMGFDLVYSMSRALFGSGFACIGERCPSNDHANGDRDFTPGHVVHSSGGYALRQRWL